MVQATTTIASSSSSTAIVAETAVVDNDDEEDGNDNDNENEENMTTTSPDKNKDKGYIPGHKLARDHLGTLLQWLVCMQKIDAASGQGQGLAQEGRNSGYTGSSSNWVDGGGGVDGWNDDDDNIVDDSDNTGDGNNGNGSGGNWSVRARCGTFLRKSGVLQRAVGLMLKLCPDPALFDKGTCVA